jgi:hypothetical protein
MNVEQAKIGAWVRSLVEFSGVPCGTVGIIVEDYGSGVTVEWSLLARDWSRRDGFNKETELHYLALVSNPQVMFFAS